MATNLSTPGVYIQEKDAFPNSVVTVPTAVPAFIGYTEKAEREGHALINKPTRISSLDEYVSLFGQGPKSTYQVAKAPSKKFKITADKSTRFNLYHSLRLFFSNGGGVCYIISVGGYEHGVSFADLNADNKGISTLTNEPEPTLLVIPDAVLLKASDCAQLQRDMLNHCGEMQNRVAILDVYDGNLPRSLDNNDVVTRARDGWSGGHLQWGAAYYPFLHTTIVQPDEVDFTSISNMGVLISMLNTEADTEYKDKAQAIKEEIAKLGEAAPPEFLHQTLTAKLPLYKDLLASIRNEMNVLPPCGGIAGVICMVDNSRGVFKPPANVSLGCVISPTVNITAEEQEDLNLPLDGKAINAIRSFPGQGVIVWGARTLDGNSQDWRYLNVRRTVIMIEQSVKTACRAYVFEPNDAGTWVNVKSMISNFLNQQWKQGALAGPTPEDAFSVEVGLGSTMAADDILNGIMNVTVKIAVSRPAEFIVLTFQQQMQKA